MLNREEKRWRKGCHQKRTYLTVRRTKARRDIFLRLAPRISENPEISCRNYERTPVLFTFFNTLLGTVRT